jgi:hypothetical protein
MEKHVPRVITNLSLILYRWIGTWRHCKIRAIVNKTRLSNKAVAG